MYSSYYVLVFSLFVSSVFPNPCLDNAVVSRRQWGSRITRTRARVVPAAKRVFIHHSLGDSCSNITECGKLIRDIETRHIRFYRFLDLGYHFIIGGDGRVYEGRGWQRQGAHAKGFNNDVGILFLGNYNDKRPPESMLRATKNLLECGKQWHVLQDGYSVFGHRNVGCTACPGYYLYSAIKDWDEFAREEALYIDCYSPYTIHSGSVKIIL